MPTILALISSGLAALGKLLGLLRTNQDERAGIAIQTASDNSAAAAAASAVAQAEVSAPRTKDELAARLTKGSF